MTFLSPSQDLAKTLRALPGLWARLKYLSHLREEGGDYAHWGLEHSHGEHGARAAMQAAHEELFIEILRTPLRELENELRGADVSDQQRVKAYLEDLNLLPENLMGGSSKHFKSILSALIALLTTAPRTARPTA